MKLFNFRNILSIDTVILNWVGITYLILPIAKNDAVKIAIISLSLMTAIVINLDEREKRTVESEGSKWSLSYLVFNTLMGWVGTFPLLYTHVGFFGFLISGTFALVGLKLDEFEKVKKDKEIEREEVLKMKARDSQKEEVKKAKKRDELQWIFNSIIKRNLESDISLNRDLIFREIRDTTDLKVSNDLWEELRIKCPYLNSQRRRVDDRF